MTWRKKHGEEVVLGPKNQLSVRTAVALGVIVIYFTGWFMKVDNGISSSVSRDQLQQWIDVMREQNRAAFPALVIPPVPPKQASTLTIKPTIAAKE